MATSTVSEKRDYLPKSLGKALLVLDCFDQAHPELSATEIGRRLGTPPSTLYRYLVMLESAGFIARVADTSRYSLGLRLAELGGVALNRLEIRRHGQPLLDALGDATGLNANLAVLYDGDAFHIAYAVRSDVDRLYTLVGRRTPAHCTALGKAMLSYCPWDEVRASIERRGWRPRTAQSITDFDTLRAELEQTRERGYAVDRGEVSLDTHCTAAPVFGQRGVIAGAVSVSGPFARFVGSEAESIATAVVQHAQMLSLRLGHASLAFGRG